MRMPLLLAACLTPSELRVEVDDTAHGVTDSQTEPTGEDTGSTSDDSGTTGDTQDTHDSAVEPVDEDGDGYATDVDCNDQDPEIHPLQFDDCDGIDDDCNGVIDDATDCPCAITWFADHAYLFCESRERWRDARDACAGVGYALVTVGSSDENAWLHETSALLSDREWWTGLNDRDDEGTFTWVSGEAVSYTNWSSGEPNDYGRGEDCAPLHSAGGEQWNDTDCDDDNRFVCEAG